MKWFDKLYRRNIFAAYVVAYVVMIFVAWGLTMMIVSWLIIPLLKHHL